MTAEEATAEVFWRAYETLSRAERQALAERILRDRKLLEDLGDHLLIEKATCEGEACYIQAVHGPSTDDKSLILCGALGHPAGPLHHLRERRHRRYPVLLLSHPMEFSLTCAHDSKGARR